MIDEFKIVFVVISILVWRGQRSQPNKHPYFYFLFSGVNMASKTILFSAISAKIRKPKIHFLRLEK